MINNYHIFVFKQFLTALMIFWVLGNDSSSRLNAYGVGISNPVTLVTGASKWKKVSANKLVLYFYFPSLGHIFLLQFQIEPNPLQ